MPTGTYDKEKDTIWPFFLNSLNPSTKVRGVLIFPDIITGVRHGNGGILGSRYGTCSRFPGPGSHSLVNYYSVVAGGASVANYRRGAAPVLAQWRFQLINMLSLCLSLSLRTALLILSVVLLRFPLHTFILILFFFSIMGFHPSNISKSKSFP